ncbi:MAG: RIP metalloprotease RseP [Paludibacteraceae bacterium]
MKTMLIQTLQLILALSLLVFVHELGHFSFARLFHVRVNKFYLFFNWKFAIVRFKKIDGKWQVRWFAPNQPTEEPAIDENGEPKLNAKGKPIMVPIDTDKLPENDWRRHTETTEWGIGWIPLGGYCSIDGMVDETTDSGQLASEPKPWEYRAQPAWKRLFIITGGVLMNFITAFVIYAAMLGYYGKEELPMQNAYLGYDYCQTALNNGFQNGDIIIAIDNDTVKYTHDATEKIIIDGKCNILLRRHGRDTTIVLPDDFAQQVLAAEEKQFLAARMPFVIEEVNSHSPAAATGLQTGDSIIGLNGYETVAFSDIIQALDTLAEQTVTITYVRHGQTYTDSITIGSDSKIGVLLRNPMPYFVTERTEYGFFAAIPAGWNQMTDVLSKYVKQLRFVFTKEGAKSLGGFGTIGSLFPPTWDWATFWSMCAFLSVILAFMNILPIPVLDGGYVLFIIFEMITGRKPSDKVMEILLNIGFFLLLALLIIANGNDLIRWLFK